MNKSFVILINNAYRMAEYHLALAKKLRTKGAKVILAFTDRLPFYTENIEGFKYYVFSEYFKENYTNIQFDKKYKSLNINKIFFSEYDRNIVFSRIRFQGNDYYQRLMTNLINFFDLIYRENEINFCLYESISNSFAYMAYEIGKINNVQYCGYAGSRLKNSFELYTEEFYSNNHFKRIFEKVLLEDISKDKLKDIDDYLSKYTTKEMPSYHPRKTVLDWDYPIFKRYFNIHKLKLIKASFLYSLRERKYIPFSYQIGDPLKQLFRSFLKQLKRKYIIRNAKKYFDKPNGDDNFFLYPQHFKPEASTSIPARHYCSDISVIENIAFNLPFGSYLYVKEHFVNYGRMSLRYYQALKNIPNVKLINCEENTKNLIDKSLAIITLTSTVGFEALMSNKPVFIFGNVFYECHPNCRKLSSFNSLENELNNLSIDNNPDINRRFVYAYKKILYPGNIGYSLGGKEYQTKDFVEPFIEAINERFFQENIQ
jgi:hypothetical protein